MLEHALICLQALDSNGKSICFMITLSYPSLQARRITPQWRQLLESVGVTAERLRDKHTALFIADFVEKHGGIEEANRQLLEATRSPPSSPVRSRAKSVMVRRGKSYRGRGRRPPPEQMQLTPPSVGASGQISE